MKILDYDKFISEKMKIIPISNDEFDKAASTNIFTDKIKIIEKPRYEDLCKAGNIVFTKSQAYLAFGSIHMNWFSESGELLRHYSVIRPSQNNRYGYSFILCNNWKTTFPFDADGDDKFDIIGICKSNIDVTSITSIDIFKNMFDKYELNGDSKIIFEKIKNNK